MTLTSRKDRADLEQYGVPAIGLKETIGNLKTLNDSATGVSCPRCNCTEFNKAGYYTYKGKKYPKKICHDCGYVFSVVDFQNDGCSQHRAAIILNLDNHKSENILDDAIRFGLIKDNGNDTFSCNKFNGNRIALYHYVPIYHYLLESVGYELKRNVFETACVSHPDLSKLSQIKRGTLWRRYKEISVEVFVCDKRCKFGKTCKKDSSIRSSCSVVKQICIEARWKVGIVI